MGPRRRGGSPEPAVRPRSAVRRGGAREGRTRGWPGGRRHHPGGVRPPAAPTNARQPWPHQPWGIAPPANAAGVGARDEGLAGDTRPDEARRPPGCGEETSPPLGAATRRPIPAAPGPPERGEDADARQGTAQLCLVFAPWAEPRRVPGTARRTAVDVAPLLRAVVEEPDPQAEQLVRVMDPLTPHPPASVSAAGSPAAACRRRARVELQHPPTPGRGWVLAETARRVLARPCVDRRIPDATTLTQEMAAWERHRQAAECRVEWRFTTAEASIHLKRLYPSIQLC